MVPSILFIFFYLECNHAISVVLRDNIDHLSENLRNDPFVLANSESSEAKEFIDKQFENYKTLVLQTQEKQFSRSKRSLPRDEQTTEENFVGLKPYRSFENCADLIIFEQKSQWYAACLKKNDEQNSTLEILKYHENEFTSTDEADISNGFRIGLFPLKSATLVIVAVNCTAFEDCHHQSNVFEFTEKEILESVQKINTPFSSDIAIWEDKRNIFMSVALFMKETPTGKTFRVESPIYKWLGKHFDIIQEVETSGGSRITPFDVDGSQFLALANSQNDEGEEEIYSRLLKYNMRTEKYELHQNILTSACRDMNYFNIYSNKDVDHFLIVANNFKKDPFDEIDYNTTSIIYKMMDDYFIPFQSLQLEGVSQWEPITNEDGDTLLTAVTINGLKFFQYDGWHFSETFSIDANIIRDIRNLRVYKFDKKFILGIQDGNKTDLFHIKFSSRNEQKLHHDEMLKWCQDNVNITTQNDSIEILGEEETDMMIEEIDIASQVQETSPVTSSSILEEYQSQVFRIEEEIKNSIQNIQKHLIEEDIRVGNLVLKNDTFVDSGEIQTINGIDVNDVPASILNIDDGFHLDSSLDFDNLRTDEPILNNMLNNHSVESILSRTSILENVTINGNVNFRDDLEVDILEDMNINMHNSLLNTGDQSLGNFSLDSLITEKVSAAILNDHLLKNLKNQNEDEGRDNEPKKSVDSVNVDNLIVGGFINDVDIPTLYKYALRKEIPQDITETYYLDSLDADSLISDNLSGRQVLDNLIPITEGTYFITKDVMFNKDLSVNNLTASQNLNNINVVDGNLDVLLKNSDERQYVSGTKSFENLELLSPINLHGKIRGKAFETMSPLVKVDQDVEINGDVRITGNAVSEGTIRSKNIITKDGKKSWENLLENGVKLNSDIMPTHLIFSQHINVDDLSTDSINSIDPSSWLVNGAKQIQIVHASKQFNGDLEIEGDTICRRINDIDMEELEGNVLRKDGDQIINGKHYVKYVATEKIINTNSTEFGRHPWKDVLITTEHQQINGTLHFSRELSARTMVISNLTVEGLMNGLNTTKVLFDGVTMNSHFRIAGNKTFRNLRIDNMRLETSNFDKFLEQLAENKLELSNLNTLRNINVESLHFAQSFNDVSNVELKNKNGTENMIVELGDQEFDSIKVFGNVFIESNRLNNIDMDDLDLNTVKIDKPHQFDSVYFANDVIVSDTIALAGHVDNLDLDNIFQNEEGGQQTILDVLDKKHFHENVTILGAVHINGNLNGVNVSDLCGFASDIKDAGSRLILEGNAVFAKGPHVFQFNGETMENLENHIWLSDMDVVLDGDFEFETNVSFNDDMNIQGFINDINLRKISKNYLSKTADQNVTGKMNFLDGIVLYEDIASPELLIEGKVNDIDISTFSKTIFLHRAQVLEDLSYLEEATIQNLKGDYSVNKLNLDSDVMRYDRPNMITGPKSLENLAIGVLKADRNITVQDVNILYWLTNAVLNYSSFNVGGKKIFDSVTAEKRVGLMGELNDLNLNKYFILLRSFQQNITGHKSYNPDPSERLKFKAMKVKESLNGIDITEMVNKQVKAHRHVINYVKSSVNFRNVSMKNLNCEKTFQGLNISDLLNNITNLEILNDFSNNYKRLLDMSTTLNQSLEEQAFYLNYFKTVPFQINANEMFAAKCDQHGSRVLTFTNENGSAIVDFFDWNETDALFVETEGYTMNLGTYPNYIKYVNLDEFDYIYLEHQETQVEDGDGYSDRTYTGELIHFSQNTTFRHHSFLTKGTLFITSFSANILQKYCLLFIDFNYGINILCKGSEEEFYLHQTIDSEKAVMASVVDTQQSPYLVTARINEPRVAIWKLNENSEFQIVQTQHEGDPISLSTISCSHGQFIAVAYGHLPNTKDYGRIVIRKFDSVTEDFTLWQTIKLKAPLQIAFALLPSQELVLFITTENPTEPFNTYIYEGISGFIKNTGSSAIPNVLVMNQISLRNEHFVIAKHVDGMSLIRAIFKGESS